MVRKRIKHGRLGTHIKSLAGLMLALAVAANVVPADAQTANTKTTYTYDALDRLIQVTDPSGLNTTYQYDGLSDPTSVTSPDTGITAKTYDAAGNVLTGTDAKGNTVTYTYDALNRRLSASYADNTQNITYTYDEANSVTGCTTSYPIGHLTRVVESGVTTMFCYNAQGYVTQASQTVSGHTDVTTYARSPGGKILSITHPSGDQVSYSYDADGRVSGVSATTSSGITTLVSNVTYLPFGPVSSYTLGNGQAVTRTYDANYHLTDLVSPTFTLHVARDAMGDITAIGNSAGANPATETYSYNPLYRLTTVTEADGSTLESVTYNQAGDRLSKTGSGLATGTYSYNPNTHQLIATGNAARSSDANGNTTAISQAGSVYGFGYNARNRLTLVQLNQSTIATYTYNAFDERVSKTANGATERYNYGPDSQILSEYGATNREYVYLDNIPVANLDSQGTTTSVAYVTADQLGTPRAISDAGGNTVWSWAYQGNPWGEQQPTSNGYTYNLRLPGQYYDTETGLSDNIHRTFDASIGGYAQPDPIGYGGGQWSLYAYGGNDPLGSIDPLGLQNNRAEIDPKEAEALNTPDTNAEIARLDRDREEAARARDTTPYVPPRPASEFGEFGQCEANPPSRAQVGPIGGVYALRDPATGDIMYIGRTNDFIRREGEHSRNPAKSSLNFDPVAPTDDYATQRGLEQSYMDAYKPSLNQRNGISPNNPNYNTYMNAAQNYQNGSGH